MAKLPIFLIRIYQYLISPLLPRSCRFYPTCSQYAVQAFQVHGLFRGGWLATFRILKCQPFHDGGYDPLPVPVGRKGYLHTPKAS